MTSVMGGGMGSQKEDEVEGRLPGTLYCTPHTMYDKGEGEGSRLPKFCGHPGWSLMASGPAREIAI